MKEEIQIEQGARLADSKAPENISTERARQFVSSKLADKSRFEIGAGISRFFDRRPALAWGGSAFAFAVAVAVAVAVILPSGEQAIRPGDVFEMESIHASSEQIDTVAVEPADSLDSVELPTVE